MTTNEWRPISDAPWDGTEVFVRNKLTHDMKILAAFGEYTSDFGSKSEQWTIVRDFDKYMPLRPGTLVVPTEWRLPTLSDGLEEFPAAAADAREQTVRILGMSYDDVEKTVYEADLPFDLLVHGTRDGSVVCVTGDGDVLSVVTKLGMQGGICIHEESAK
jgi:hypothetical protein